jgi:hypothetical protein
MSFLVKFMQSAYTKVEHDKVKEAAEPVELKLPEPLSETNPIFEPNLDYIHSLAGSPNVGVVGFETFGMGYGHQAGRRIATSEEAKEQDVIYDDEGNPYVNAAVEVYNSLYMDTQESKIANTIFKIWSDHYNGNGYGSYVDRLVRWIHGDDYDPELHGAIDEVTEDEEHFSFNQISKLIEEIEETSSYWAVCELIVKYVTENDYTSTNYTANNGDNMITQDVHYTIGTDSCPLAGVYFHTGGDIRCGFSAPVFGELGDLYIDDRPRANDFEVEGPDGEKIGWLSELLWKFDKKGLLGEVKGVYRNRVPYDDEAYEFNQFLTINDLYEVEPYNQIGNSRYHLDVEFTPTEKMLKIIRKYTNPSKDLNKIINGE